MLYKRAIEDLGEDSQIGLTDYAKGYLRGWSRIFKRGGFYVSIDPRSQVPNSPTPVGDPPTVAEWRAFDAQAQSMGVGGLTAQLEKNARPATGFMASLSRSLSDVGQGIASGKLDKSFKGAEKGLLAVSDEISTVVPGAGPIVTNALLSVLFPALPFAGIAGGLAATVAGNVPFAGNLLGPLVSQGEEVVGKSVFGGNASGGLTLPTVGPQQPIPIPALQTLVDQASAVAPDVSALKGSLLKLNQTFQDTGGSLAAKLEATSREAFSELDAAITIVSILPTGGLGAGFAVLSIAASAVKAGLTVETAAAAAAAMRSASRAARNAAQAEINDLDAQERELLAELRRLRAQRAALAAKRSSVPGTPQDGLLKGLGIFAAAVLVAEVLA